MRKELFEPYKKLILHCIGKAETKLDLQVCHDMVDHFSDRFMFVMPVEQINEATTEMWSVYQLKINSETII